MAEMKLPHGAVFVDWILGIARHPLISCGRACVSGRWIGAIFIAGDPGDRYIDDTMTRGLDLLLKSLKWLGIAYILTILLCVWEFTIGIKHSIKKCCLKRKKKHYRAE